jgi:hypothetical protein
MFLSRYGGILTHCLGHLTQALVHQVADRPFFETAILLPLAGRDPCQDLNPFIDGLDRPDVEVAGLNGLNYFLL